MALCHLNQSMAEAKIKNVYLLEEKGELLNLTKLLEAYGFRENDTLEYCDYSPRLKSGAF